MISNHISFNIYSSHASKYHNQHETPVSSWLYDGHPSWREEPAEECGTKHSHRTLNTFHKLSMASCHVRSSTTCGGGSYSQYPNADQYVVHIVHNRWRFLQKKKCHLFHHRHRHCHDHMIIISFSLYFLLLLLFLSHRRSEKIRIRVILGPCRNDHDHRRGDLDPSLP